MSFKYFDSHSHLNLEQFNDDKEEVIESMKGEEVATLTVGTSFSTSKEALRLANLHENLYACIGLHPNEVVNESFDIKNFESLLGNKTVCVGECGLDYFRSSNKTEQEVEFRKQIEFALENNLPLMLHIRQRKGTMDAYEDTLDILEEYKKTFGDKLRGQAHFFAGDINIAKRFLDIGFYISFTGVITFTHDYDEVLRFVQEDRILTETDSPFVAPVPYRGHRSEPNYVIEVYKKMSEIRGVSLDDLIKQVRENIKNLYKI